MNLLKLERMMIDPIDPSFRQNSSIFLFLWRDFNCHNRMIGAEQIGQYLTRAKQRDRIPPKKTRTWGLLKNPILSSTFPAKINKIIFELLPQNVKRFSSLVQIFRFLKFLEKNRVFTCVNIYFLNLLSNWSVPIFLRQHFARTFRKIFQSALWQLINFEKN